MDLKEEQAIGGDPQSHWYYVSKWRAIKALIGEAPYKSVLDVGAGSGVFSRMMLMEGLAGKSVCLDPNYTDAWLSDHRDDQIQYVRGAGETDAELVMMIDVIEHTDDDVSSMAYYVQMAAPGTKFVISVPAFNFLWSSHDDFLEHRRRYTLETLELAVVAAGLRPLKLRYFFGILFPAVAAMRIADRAVRGDRDVKSALKPTPQWLSKALIAIHEVERRAIFPINRLAGVTVFCLAERPVALAKAADAA
jgi:2-polyprenyl-3-methyl-5-hydroxy-6-metoxy-1,4-benzoquinol methylase